MNELALGILIGFVVSFIYHRLTVVPLIRSIKDMRYVGFNVQLPPLPSLPARPEVPEL